RMYCNSRRKHATVAGSARVPRHTRTRFGSKNSQSTKGVQPMFKMLTRGSVRLVERYLPDPYIFVLLLTILAFICAMVFEGQSPYAVVRMWGGGFWGLLTFAMQMVLVLLTGFMLASTPLVKRWLDNLAGKARTPGRAIVMVSLVGLAASWINWGFGLVVGALFAKALARQ